MLVVSTTGFTLLVIGVVLLVLPGPGIPVLIAAFLVLGLEFAWAEQFLHRLRNQAKTIRGRGRSDTARLRAGEPLSSPVTHDPDQGADRDPAADHNPSTFQGQERAGHPHDATQPDDDTATTDRT